MCPRPQEARAISLLQRKIGFVWRTIVHGMHEFTGNFQMHVTGSKPFIVQPVKANINSAVIETSCFHHQPRLISRCS